MDRQRFSVNRLVARSAVGMIRTVNSQPQEHCRSGFRTVLYELIKSSVLIQTRLFS